VLLSSPFGFDGRDHALHTDAQEHSDPVQGVVDQRCFVSDLTEKIRVWQPDLWLHGHTHDSFDYRVGRTRIVCNARGYAKGGVNENSLFDPGFTIDLDR
jgi:hypothetical protein